MTIGRAESSRCRARLVMRMAVPIPLAALSPHHVAQQAGIFDNHRGCYKTRVSRFASARVGASGRLLRP